LDTSALDPTFKEHAARGIGRYVRELTHYFASCSDAKVRVLPFDHRTLIPYGWVGRLSRGRQTLKQQLLYPLRLGFGASLGFDIVHFPAHMDAPAWSPCAYILTVLDLVLLVCADLYRAEQPGWRFRLARWLEIRAIKNASLILAISENTAQDVHHLLDISPARIVVTPLGVNEKFFSARLVEDEAVLRRRYGIPLNRPILLYVGGIDQRKNSATLLEAFRIVLHTRRASGGPLPVLVMVGKIQHDRQYPKLKALIRTKGLVGDVVLPGYISDEDLLQLYCLTSVCCFLSLYEGFGLPPLEAMAAGVPVVCSNTSSLPEVVGNAAALVAPHDAALAAKTILRVLDDAAYAGFLSECGRKRARLFPWSRTGATTLAAYERFAQHQGRY
jgi:glycosyltransferase involved in cell wall biosynthesis